MVRHANTSCALCVCLGFVPCTVTTRQQAVACSDVLQDLSTADCMMLSLYWFTEVHLSDSWTKGTASAVQASV